MGPKRQINTSTGDPACPWTRRSQVGSWGPPRPSDSFFQTHTSPVYKICSKFSHNFFKIFEVLRMFSQNCFSIFSKFYTFTVLSSSLCCNWFRSAKFGLEGLNPHIVFRPAPAANNGAKSYVPSSDWGGLNPHIVFRPAPAANNGAISYLLKFYCNLRTKNEDATNTAYAMRFQYKNVNTWRWKQKPNDHLWQVIFVKIKKKKNKPNFWDTGDFFSFCFLSSLYKNIKKSYKELQAEGIKYSGPRYPFLKSKGSVSWITNEIFNLSKLFQKN